MGKPCITSLEWRGIEQGLAQGSQQGIHSKVCEKVCGKVCNKACSKACRLTKHIWECAVVIATTTRLNQWSGRIGKIIESCRNNRVI